MSKSKSKTLYGIFFNPTRPHATRRTLLARTKAAGVSYEDRMNFPSRAAAEKVLKEKLPEFADELEVSEYGYV